MQTTVTTPTGPVVHELATFRMEDGHLDVCSQDDGSTLQVFADGEWSSVVTVNNPADGDGSTSAVEVPSA